jgi:hypothetical protein
MPGGERSRPGFFLDNIAKESLLRFRLDLHRFAYPVFIIGSPCAFVADVLGLIHQLHDLVDVLRDVVAVEVTEGLHGISKNRGAKSQMIVISPLAKKRQSMAPVAASKLADSRRFIDNSMV